MTISSHNTCVESLTLQQSLHALATAISADLIHIQIASKLVKNDIISSAELRQAYQPAGISAIFESVKNIVKMVIAQVKLHPEKYGAFMKALEESGVPQEIVRDLCDKYKENKKSKVT